MLLVCVHLIFISAANRFFSNIKQHHLNEVKMVKKHEDQLQAVASRVMPFFRVGRLPAML